MVSVSDKEKLRTSLTEKFDEFIATFSSFSDQGVNRRYPSSSWTPVMVASHIIMATDGVPDHNTWKDDRAYDALLDKIRPWWEDLNQKFQSPESLWPNNNAREKNEVLSELRRVREKDISIIDTQDLSLICADVELPSIGYLTRFEWLWFIDMHLKRHSFQLRKMTSN
jgi:hypothetical protein